MKNIAFLLALWMSSRIVVKKELWPLKPIVLWVQYVSPSRMFARGHQLHVPLLPGNAAKLHFQLTTSELKRKKKSLFCTYKVIYLTKLNRNLPY